jgi:hypothetical protein
LKSGSQLRNATRRHCEQHAAALVGIHLRHTAHWSAGEPRRRREVKQRDQLSQLALIGNRKQPDRFFGRRSDAEVGCGRLEEQGIVARLGRE